MYFINWSVKMGNNHVRLIKWLFRQKYVYRNSKIQKNLKISFLIQSFQLANMMTAPSIWELPGNKEASRNNFFKGCSCPVAYASHIITISPQPQPSFRQPLVYRVAYMAKIILRKPPWHHWLWNLRKLGSKYFIIQNFQKHGSCTW